MQLILGLQIPLSFIGASGLSKQSHIVSERLFLPAALQNTFYLRLHFSKILIFFGQAIIHLANDCVEIVSDHVEINVVKGF